MFTIVYMCICVYIYVPGPGQRPQDANNNKQNDNNDNDDNDDDTTTGDNNDDNDKEDRDRKMRILAVGRGVEAAKSGASAGEAPDNLNSISIDLCVVFMLKLVKLLSSTLLQSILFRPLPPDRSASGPDNQLSICLSIYLFIYLSIYLSIYLCIYIYIYIYTGTVLFPPSF